MKRFCITLFVLLTPFVCFAGMESHPGYFSLESTGLLTIDDIEVDIKDGYPDVKTADKYITSIAYKSSKSEDYYLLGLKGYDKSKTLLDLDPENIHFMEFDSEELLLKRFKEI